MSGAAEARARSPWVEYNFGIGTEDGQIILSHHATAECPKAGDYYGCGTPPRAKSKLFLTPENKALIVEAVNSHAALVAERDALRKALKPLAEYDPQYPPMPGDIEAARAALSPAHQREGK